jgi:hypothetical protein
MTMGSWTPETPRQSERVAVPLSPSARRSAWFLYIMMGIQMAMMMFIVALPWFLSRPEHIRDTPVTKVPALDGSPFVPPAPATHPAPPLPSSGEVAGTDSIADIDKRIFTRKR